MDSTPTQAVEVPQPSFGLPNPPSLRGRTPWFTEATTHPGRRGIPANFRSTQPTLRGRTQWFTDGTPNQGAEESQPSFGLTNPPSEVEPRGLRTATPKQGAEKAQPNFGLPYPPSEVEPRGLRTSSPSRERRNPSQLSVYQAHPRGRTQWFKDNTPHLRSRETQPTFGLPNPPSEVKPRGLRTAIPPPPDQAVEVPQPNFGLSKPPLLSGHSASPPTHKLHSPA